MDLRERAVRGEARHPWELARMRHFVRVLERGGVLQGPVAVLDVGAGDGWLGGEVLGVLPSGSSLVCWDLHYDDAALASLPEGAEGTREAPSGRRFGLVMMMDVLEHVDDDGALLRSVAGDLLEPGGRVLLSVPAWPALMTSHDEALGHHRRYRPEEGRRLLESCGLRIEVSGGLFSSLIAPRFAAAVAERLMPPDDVQARPLAWRHGALAGSLVGGVLGADARLGRVLARRGLEAPGLTWWALARGGER